MVEITEIKSAAGKTAAEIIEKADLKQGDILVIGCSTSEVLGERIGTSGSVEPAQEIFNGLMSVFEPDGIYIAAQCCEHLNRAIIIEKEKAE